MKAFAFRSSKKSQQRSDELQLQQQRRQQPQQQHSWTSFQLSLSLSKSRTSQDQLRHDQIPTPSMTPSPIPSPTHSTVSFGPINSGSFGAVHTRGPKARPSLSMLRPSGFHTMSSDGHSPYQSEQRARSPIYSRFGFNRSTPQLLPRSTDIGDPPSSAKTPVLQEFNGRPPMPTRPTPPPPPKSAAIPSTNQIDTSPKLVELPPVPNTPLKPDSQISRRSPDKPNQSIDGLEVPLENDLSTSTLLQRRRAKSLGPAGNAPGQEGPGNTNVGPRLTNLVIPPLVIDKTPLTLQPGTPTSISPISLLPTPTTPGRPLLGPMSAPLQSRNYLTYPHSHSPSPIPSRSQSPSYKSGSSRTRSESNSSSRTRSESNSSRARSESNASNSSSSRHGHRSKRASVRATMVKLDDAWSGFLKEVDEDLAELSGTKNVLEDGPSNPESAGLTPSETIKSSLVKPILPLRTQSPISGRTRGDSRSQTPTTSTTPKPGATHTLSNPSSKILVTISPVASSENIGGVNMQSRDSDSSLPYLRTPEASFSPPPDSNPHGPLKHFVPPPVTQLLGSQSSQLAQLRQADKNLNRMSTGTFDSEDSRPGSSYSQMSQFSLSMFPSPPSVPVMRLTTENGTFKVGPKSSSNDGHEDEGAGNSRTLKFKPIVQPSGAGRSLIKNLFFARDKESASEGGSRTVTPSRSTTPTPSDPGMSDSSEASVSTRSRSPTPNYEALLKSMESRKGGESFQPSLVSTGNTFPQAPHSLFDVGPGGGGGGNGASRPGTADSKFQWGYAL